MPHKPSALSFHAEVYYPECDIIHTGAKCNIRELHPLKVDLLGGTGGTEHTPDELLTCCVVLSMQHTALMHLATGW